MQKSSGSPNLSILKGKRHSTDLQEQQLCENFANVFLVLKPCNFCDLFSLTADVDSDTGVNALELLYHAIFANPMMIVIPQKFLAGGDRSRKAPDGNH